MSTKISQLTSAVDVTANDLIQIVDVEDGVMAPSGTNKKATASLLANQLVPLINTGAIAGSKIADSGITSAKIADGTIVNADINASAAIAGTKISPDFGSQNIVTTGSFSAGVGSVISGSSSGDILRINQTGGGNALVVEDSANPDSTPTVITASGNVGIGTNSPADKLEVNGNMVCKDSTQFGGFALKNATNTIGYMIGTTATNDGGQIGLLDGNIEKVVIKSNGDSVLNGGNVGIGTSSPSYQLQLSTDSAAKPSTSTWTISSDERLKENIEDADLDICYNAVKNIPLKRYKWKDEIYSAEQVADRSKIGWIAQDVQAVFPKAVNEHKFVYNQVRDEDDNVVSEDSIDDCLSLNSDQIYAALFGAVQKLMGEVESLQERIAELEAAP